MTALARLPAPPSQHGGINVQIFGHLCNRAACLFGQLDGFLLKRLAVLSPLLHDTPPRLVWRVSDVSVKSGEDQEMLEVGQLLVE